MNLKSTMNLYVLTETIPYGDHTILGIYDSQSKATKGFKMFAATQNQLNPTAENIATLLKSGTLDLRDMRQNYYNITVMKLNQLNQDNF